MSPSFSAMVGSSLASSVDDLHTPVTLQHRSQASVGSSQRHSSYPSRLQSDPLHVWRGQDEVGIGEGKERGHVWWREGEDGEHMWGERERSEGICG